MHGHPFSCLNRTAGAAAWYAVQEAAKHCTAVRMRTHLGNPSQTFAALEQTLQALLSKLSADSSDLSSATADTVASAPQLYAVPAARSTSEAPLLEPAWMLLEMMHALEKNMYSAYAGSCLRPAAYAGTAIAFYKSNRKASLTSLQLPGKCLWHLGPSCSAYMLLNAAGAAVPSENFCLYVVLQILLSQLKYKQSVPGL